MMPMLTLSVAIMLAGVALVLAFFPRVPAAALAFAAMVIAALSGFMSFESSELLFWGVVAAIASAIGFLSKRPSDRLGQIYIVAGTLAGAVVGLAIGSKAAVSLSAAIGGFMGFEAYRRTPAGRQLASTTDRIDLLASICLPAIASFSIIMLILAKLLLLK